MKGVYQHQPGKWRVNIMVHGKRMTKVCYSYEQAVQTAETIRSFLNLKPKDQKGSIMYTVNKNGQIMENVARPAVTPGAGTVQTFTFPATGQGVRIIQKDGQPWFVAKDVCDCLELTNITEALRALDADELSSEILKSGMQGREMRLVSQSGLYALVFRSTKPEARAFSKWVRAEVLPSIERTGGYIIANPEESPETLMARALFVAKDSIDRLNHQLEEAQPKIEAYEELYSSEGDCTLTEAAKHFGMSAQRLNVILRAEHWLFKNAVDQYGEPIVPVNLPYQSIVDKGYAVVKSRTARRGGYRCTQTYITPRGLIAIERLLRRRFDA